MKPVYSILKAYVNLDISKSLSWLFGYAEEWVDKKHKVNFKIYSVPAWTTNK